MPAKPPNRPVLAPACVFLAGVAVEAGASPQAQLAIGCLLALGAATLLRSKCRRGAALIALITLLAWIAGVHGMRCARSRAEARTARWVEQRGEPVELDLTGTVRSLAERDPRGGWSIRMAARRSASEAGGATRWKLSVARGEGAAASAIEALLPGDEIRVWCRARRPARDPDPRRGDREEQLRARGIDLEGTVKSARLIERTRAGAPSFARAVAAAKAFARRRLDRGVGDDALARALLGAMILGDRAAVDPEVERLLRDAGLVHLLSVSGLHVALVVLALWAVLSRLRLARALRLLVMLAGITALVALVGADAPVVRAGACAALLLVGHALGRDGDPLNTLAGVAALLVARDPYVILNLGFQLSFAATAGILCLARPIAAALPIPEPIALATGVSAGAYLASAPLALFHFGRGAPVALLSNLAASAVCAATMAAGAGVIALGNLPVLGPLSGWAARASIHVLIGVAQLATHVPAGAFRVGSPAPWLLAAYFGALAAVVRQCERGNGNGAPARLKRLACALLLAALHLGPPPGGREHDVALSVIDVGQGQAVALRGPSGGFVVIDAGGTGGGRFDAGDRRVAPFLAAHGCRRIEALVVTHGHDDHAGGAHALLRDFEVGELWLSAGYHHDATLARLAARAHAVGTALVLVERGAVFRRAGAQIHVLHPTRGAAHAAQNERSIVLLCALGERRLLVPGDLEAAGERSLLTAGADVRADVLVVAHHGSSSSSSAAFLDAVRPAAAIVSCGAGNRFGHPAADVLDRLRTRGVRLWRTDEQGTIRARLRPAGTEIRSALTAP